MTNGATTGSSRIPGHGSRNEAPLVKAGPELYNLREDPAEQANLAEQEPERVEDMDRRMREFTRRLLDHEGA